jgi:hypothetical protein
MYYTFFFNVDAVVCQNNGQFQVWQFIVIVEIKYFLNLIGFNNVHDGSLLFQIVKSW